MRPCERRIGKRARLDECLGERRRFERDDDLDVPVGGVRRRRDCERGREDDETPFQAGNGTARRLRAALPVVVDDGRDLGPRAAHGAAVADEADDEVERELQAEAGEQEVSTGAGARHRDEQAGQQKRKGSAVGDGKTPRPQSSATPIRPGRRCMKCCAANPARAT